MLIGTVVGDLVSLHSVILMLLINLFFYKVFVTLDVHSGPFMVSVENRRKFDRSI